MPPSKKHHLFIYLFVCLFVFIYLQSLINILILVNYNCSLVQRRRKKNFRACLSHLVHEWITMGTVLDSICTPWPVELEVMENPDSVASIKKAMLTTIKFKEKINSVDLFDVIDLLFFWRQISDYQCSFIDVHPLMCPCKKKENKKINLQKNI